MNTVPVRMIVLFVLSGLVFFGLPVQAADEPAKKSANETGKTAKPENVVKQPVSDQPTTAADVVKTLDNYWSESEDAAPNATALDLRQCVEMALSKNAQALMAQDEIDAAKERIGQAQSARLPKVSTDVGFSYFEADNDGGGISSLLGASTGTAPLTIAGALLQPGGVDYGDLFSGVGSLLMTPTIKTHKDARRDHIAASQVLYAGGQIKAGIKASEFLARSTEWQKQAKLNDLEFETKQAYYDCLLARAMVRVAQESVQTFERHRADAQQMFDVGVISNFEVLRAKTELGARQADLTAAKNAERLALVNLRRMLTLPQDAPIKLAGKLELPAEPEPLNALLKQAQDTRPEIKALDNGISAGQQNVKRMKGQYLPQASGQVEYTHTEHGGLFAQDGWTFSLGGKWDLYVGGKRVHDVGEAEAKLRSLDHQKQDLLRLIEMDVRAAHIQMEDALARIEREKGTVELGLEGRRLAALRFQEGVGTQVDMLDAELALTNAETTLVRAMRDCAVAQAAIEKAAGRGWVKPEFDIVKK